MPYAYRRMSAAEREEVVRQRQALGYPLHAPPHPFRGGGAYIVTAATFEHAPILAMPERRSDFSARLLTALRGIPADVFGWVVLPNHYHVLIGVRSLDDVAPAIKQLHGATSREWNLADGMTGRRRVWYKFADRRIRDDRHLYKALNYIHGNPVKHGYRDSPGAWPWSSLRNYVTGEGMDWLRRIEAEYPPGDFGSGWDDL